MKPEEINNKLEQELSEEDLDGATGGGIGGSGKGSSGGTGEGVWDPNNLPKNQFNS